MMDHPNNNVQLSGAYAQANTLAGNQSTVNGNAAGQIATSFHHQQSGTLGDPLQQNADLQSSYAKSAAKNELEIHCELKFGNQEPKKSDNFIREEQPISLKNTTSNLQAKFLASVWQGKLNKQNWFPFEMELDDDYIQLKSLQIKVCDDTADGIGLVQIDVSPLLFKEKRQQCEGWFPIYSVDKGITGELEISIYIEYTADEGNDHQPISAAISHQTKQISFFSSKAPPYYEVQQIIGFVEELVDFKLEKTMQEDLIALQESVLRLRRRLGEIVKKKNGNAIITYRQSVEHTGDQAKRVVLRGYGTAALVQIDEQAQFHMLESAATQTQTMMGQFVHQSQQQQVNQQLNTAISGGGTVSVIDGQQQQVPVLNPEAMAMQTSPKQYAGLEYGSGGIAGSSSGTLGNIGGVGMAPEGKVMISQTTAEMVSPAPLPSALFRNAALVANARGPTHIDGNQKQKIQLITTDSMPGGEHELNYAIRFGCAVSARAVRKLSSEKQYEQTQQQAKRLTSKIAAEWNQWWGELRQEIYKSAKQLNCSHVLGYRENVTIYGQMCIFTASGTAVRATPATQKKYSLNQVSRYYKIAQKKASGEGSTKLGGSSGKRQGLQQQQVAPTSIMKDESGVNSRSRFHQSNNVDFSSGTDLELKAKRRVSIQDHIGSPGALPNQQAASQLKNSDKASDHSSKSTDEAKFIVADELKPDIQSSCKFCHIVPPRKKVKYPQQGVGHGMPKHQAKSEFVPDPNLHKCLSCGDRYVPEVIIATINPPDGLQIIGRPLLIEARAIKLKSQKRKETRHQEQDLMAFSDLVFLIEYNLHNQLLTKLKLAGKNALFCYRTSINVNATSITGLATGTAVCLQALPLSKPIRIVPSQHLNDDEDDIRGEEQMIQRMATDGPLLLANQSELTRQQVFSIIENLSRFNIRQLMEQSIVSIQSPYTYMRDLPKKRVIENLVATKMSLADQNAMGTVGGNQMSDHEPIKLNIKLAGGSRTQKEALELSAIPETCHDAKSSTTPKELASKPYSQALGPMNKLKENRHNKLNNLTSGLNNEISCEINSSAEHTEQDKPALLIQDQEQQEQSRQNQLSAQQQNNQAAVNPPPQASSPQMMLQQMKAEVQEEQRLIVLVKDTKKNSPPKRLDFSGLVPDSKISSDGKEERKVRIRSGSLSEKMDMEYLISTNNLQGLGKQNHHSGNNSHGDLIESPAVLVIRSKKHSLDEGEKIGESSQILEAETYKMQRSQQGKPEWTKETLLKEYNSKQPNRRGLLTFNQFSNNNQSSGQQQIVLEQAEEPQAAKDEREADLLENMVQYYNSLSAHVNSHPVSIMKQTNRQEAPQNNLDQQFYTPQQVPPQHYNMVKDGVVIKHTSEVKPKHKFEDSTLSMILQINDQNDVESLKSLMEPILPPSIILLSSYYDLVNYNFQVVEAIEDVQFYARMFRFRMFADKMSDAGMAGADSRGVVKIGRHQQRQRRKAFGSDSKEAMRHQNEFNRVMQSAYKELASDLIKRKLTPCVVCSLRTQEKIHDDNSVDVFFTCSILRTKEQRPHFFLKQTKKEHTALMKAKIDLPADILNWYPTQPDGLQSVGDPKEHLSLTASNQTQLIGTSAHASSMYCGNGLLTQQASSNSAKNLKPPSSRKLKKPKEKSSSIGGFFSSLFCSSKKPPRQQYTQYSSSSRYRNVRNVSADESIRLLPMSIFPGMSIRENYGLVDVHLIRQVYLPEEEFTQVRSSASPANRPTATSPSQLGIELVIEDIVADLNEIVRTRVRSLGGNCLIGYRVSIDGFDQIFEENKVYLIMSAIGDAVLLEEQKQQQQNQAKSHSVVSDDQYGANSSDKQHSDKNMRSEFNIDEEHKSNALRLPGFNKAQ